MSHDEASNAATVWPQVGAPLNPRSFDALAPLEVLAGGAAPTLFTAMLDTDLVLVYVASVDRQRQTEKLIVVPTSESEINALKNGSNTVLQALDQARVWAITRSVDGEVKTAVSLAAGLASVPAAFKPAPATKLPLHLLPRSVL